MILWLSALNGRCCITERLQHLHFMRLLLNLISVISGPKHKCLSLCTTTSWISNSPPQWGHIKSSLVNNNPPLKHCPFQPSSVLNKVVFSNINFGRFALTSKVTCWSRSALLIKLIMSVLSNVFFVTNIVTKHSFCT